VSALDDRNAFTDSISRARRSESSSGSSTIQLRRMAIAASLVSLRDIEPVPAHAPPNALNNVDLRVPPFWPTRINIVSTLQPGARARAHIHAQAAYWPCPR
jgi:hypothetical protein